MISKSLCASASVRALVGSSMTMSYVARQNLGDLDHLLGRYAAIPTARVTSIVSRCRR